MLIAVVATPDLVWYILRVDYVAHMWLCAPVLVWNKGGQEGCWMRQSHEAAGSILSSPGSALHWDGFFQAHKASVSQLLLLLPEPRLLVALVPLQGGFVPIKDPLSMLKVCKHMHCAFNMRIHSLVPGVVFVLMLIS
ncbi:hypothetical protein Anapl_05565 [Anas platyrhynchos]|uniref:Uncharacterized protein n=1 Tax=Anas platyrhynchos TaxID=8839 RepID=R0LRS1_ANAPL|nr:hypothetical protein Anapl_05565 [Anas platyrhynchos]